MLKLPLKLENSERSRNAAFEYPRIRFRRFLEPRQQHRVTTSCNYAFGGTQVKVLGGGEGRGREEKERKKFVSDKWGIGRRAGEEQAARSCNLFPDFKFTATLTVYIRNTCIRADGYSCLTARVQRRINGVPYARASWPRTRSLKNGWQALSRSGKARFESWECWGKNCEESGKSINTLLIYVLIIGLDFRETLTWLIDRFILKN